LSGTGRAATIGCGGDREKEEAGRMRSAAGHQAGSKTWVRACGGEGKEGIGTTEKEVDRFEVGE
jgi:hypothetical protein